MPRGAWARSIIQNAACKWVFRSECASEQVREMDMQVGDVEAVSINWRDVSQVVDWLLGKRPPRRVDAQDLQLIEILPPRNNLVDALEAETLLSALAGKGLFSLELAGDSRGSRFLVRAPRRDIKHIKAQIQAVYDQVEFIGVPPEEDPARQRDASVSQACLRLRRSVQLPLRTYRDGDFKESDPIRGLLGMFGNLEPSECALSQLVLAPAPPNWSDRYQGSTRRIERTLNDEVLTPENTPRKFVGGVAFFIILLIAILNLVAFQQRQWLTLAFALPLLVCTIAGVAFLYNLFTQDQNADPILVQHKIGPIAYDVSFRLTAMAANPETATARLRAMATAYRQYDLASGNALMGYVESFDPQALEVETWPWWREWLGRVMRLNVSELSSLWHLPIGEGTQMVNRTMTKRLLPPRPEMVSNGVLIGYSMHQGQRIPVHLSYDALDHHAFLVAKTQKGKTTLMTHLAQAAMARDSAIVVIDPHGDLARSLIGLVPPKRVGDVIYVDFSDMRRVVGFNLLDMSQGRSIDAIVSNIVHVGELVWKDYWGPRMEDALRIALRTLLEANQQLYARGGNQFTLIDIPPLFELDEFRRKFLAQFVRNDQTLLWWGGYYQQMQINLRIEVINPVLTKIHRFSTHEIISSIVGQSLSTINFRDLLESRRILLVNTATGIIGPDAGGLLGSVLVDYINFAVREQMRTVEPSKRARILVIVDEFQSLPGVDYPGLLAELQKMGASFILATQALSQLDALDPLLRPAILSNVDSLFVFQTSAEDAFILRRELDEAVETTDIINLDNYTCYLKTKVGARRLPVMHIQTLPPPQANSTTVEQVIGQMPRYTRPIGDVIQQRARFKERWYGRELRLVKRVVLGGGSGDKTPSERLESESRAEAATGTEKAQAAVTTNEGAGVFDEEKQGQARITQAVSELAAQASPVSQTSTEESRPANESHSTSKMPEAEQQRGKKSRKGTRRAAITTSGHDNAGNQTSIQDVTAPSPTAAHDTGVKAVSKKKKEQKVQVPEIKLIDGDV
jgi:Helicase HerA, central domain/Type IV secretion-system coupling protein DNA-binding domain